MGAEHGGRTVLARGWPRARGRQLPSLGALPRPGPNEGHSPTLLGQHLAQARVLGCQILMKYFLPYRFSLQGDSAGLRIRMGCVHLDFVVPFILLCPFCLTLISLSRFLQKVEESGIIKVNSTQVRGPVESPTYG